MRIAVGCAGSRTYTGMQELELTVGIPSKLIRDLVEGLRAIVGRSLHGETSKCLRVMSRRIQRKERFCVLLDQIQRFFLIDVPSNRPLQKILPEGWQLQRKFLAAMLKRACSTARNNYFENSLFIRIRE
jgi:hypothetical protein